MIPVLARLYRCFAIVPIVVALAAALASCTGVGSGPNPDFGRPVGSVELPAPPTAVAVSPAGDAAAVVCGSAVVRAALPSLATAQVSLPAAGADVDWASTGTVLVSSTVGNRVFAVDLTGGNVATPVDFADDAAAVGVGTFSPGTIVVRPGEAWVALGAPGVGGVAVADPLTGQAVRPFVGLAGATTALGSTADRGRFFVAQGQQVSSIERASATVTWTAVVAHPVAAVTTASLEGAVFAVGGSGATANLTALGIFDGNVRARVPLRGAPQDVASSAPGRYAFIAETGNRTVATVDTTARSFAVIRRLALAEEPVALALTPDRSLLLVACTASNRLVALNVRE